EMQRDLPVIAGDDLELDTKIGEVGQGVLNPWLGRIQKQQETGEDQILLVGATVVRLQPDRLARHAQHPKAARTPFGEALLNAVALGNIQWNNCRRIWY